MTRRAISRRKQLVRSVDTPVDIEAVIVARISKGRAAVCALVYVLQPERVVEGVVIHSPPIDHPPHHCRHCE